MNETATAICVLTPRCKVEQSCKHHARGCEHAAGWKAEREQMAKDLESLRGEITIMERIRDELLTLSWEARRRALEWMWSRFIDNPRCSDDPPEAPDDHAA